MRSKLSEAFEFALSAHDGQFRKGSKIPYISHPMAVSALVMKYGGSEDQAIAALLHDTMEDCGVSFEEIENQFGTHVATIVQDCSDHVGAKSSNKAPWRERKEKYITHLASAHPDALLISAADKLHNMGTTIRDLKYLGAFVWQRFSVGPELVLWYHREVHRKLVLRSTESRSLPLIMPEFANSLQTLERSV